MKDPIRWTDDPGEALNLEREVLMSDRELGPTASDSAVVWGKLANELGLTIAPAAVPAAAELLSRSEKVVTTGSAPVATTPALPTGAGASFAFIKGLVVGIVACGAAWSGSRLLSSPSPANVSQPPAASQRNTVELGKGPPSLTNAGATTAAPISSPPAAANPRAPRDARATPQAAAAPAGAPRPSVAEFGDSEPPTPAQAIERESALRQEALLLRRAAQQMRTGDLEAASRSLNESTQRFAAPQLYQEREALVIELLSRSGRRAVAAERARAFLRAFPDSAHSSRVEGFLGPVDTKREPAAPRSHD